MTDYRNPDFVNTISAAVKTYLEDYLEGRNVEVNVGYPNFTDKLPLAKAHISVTPDGNIGCSPFGFDDPTKLVVGYTIDVWTSRGTSTNPSKSGGEIGLNRISAMIVAAFEVDQEGLFDLYEGIEDISYRGTYTRRITSQDQLDLFQSSGELQITITSE